MIHHSLTDLVMHHLINETMTEVEHLRAGSVRNVSINQAEIFGDQDCRVDSRFTLCRHHSSGVNANSLRALPDRIHRQPRWERQPGFTQEITWLNGLVPCVTCLSSKTVRGPAFPADPGGHAGNWWSAPRR